MASRPGAAPGELSFGDSAARWCATYGMKLIGVARTSARHAMPLQQRTNTITAAHVRAAGCGHRYFTVDLSVFGAHLPRSP